MRFTKMQGIGNDYVYINGLEERIGNPSALAVRLSDRHFGIGSDGLILIQPSELADFRMEMYNADGSLGAMCGNGIRCVAKYVYDHGMTEKKQLRVETASGVKTLDLTVKDGRVSEVRVDMGAPVLSPAQIPVIPEKMCGQSFPEGPVISQALAAGGVRYAATCVSMGNPHCIVPVEDVDGLAIETIGPLFEHHPCFPDRVNTEFIRVLDRQTVQMRVWERGSGETLACGTGACAVTVACILNGWTEDAVTVKLLGGELKVFWDRKADTVYMTGPAETVFEGEIQE